MTLTRALQLLASVHTLDRDGYFETLFGPVDPWKAARISRTEYFEAWGIVRHHAAFGAGDGSLPGALIRDVVAQHYGISVNEMMGPSHLRAYARPRHVAMFVCVDYAGLTLPATGRIFGRRHHSSVVHALNSVRARKLADPAFAAELATVIRQCQEEHDETPSRVQASTSSDERSVVAAVAAE